MIRISGSRNISRRQSRRSSYAWVSAAGSWNFSIVLDGTITTDCCLLMARNCDGSQARAPPDLGLKIHTSAYALSHGSRGDARGGFGGGAGGLRGGRDPDRRGALRPRRQPPRARPQPPRAGRRPLRARRDRRLPQRRPAALLPRHGDGHDALALLVLQRADPPV